MALHVWCVIYQRYCVLILTYFLLSWSLDACDIGTVANQTINGEPVAATVNGDTGKGGILSYLPGQRLSRCTCKGEIHPGPVHSDGTYVGRAAPEIDVFEAQVGFYFHTQFLRPTFMMVNVNRLTSTRSSLVSHSQRSGQ